MRGSHYNKMCVLLPPATKLGQSYVFTCVCDSVHRVWCCLKACWDTTTPGPQEQRPPPRGPGTPGSSHPQGQSPPLPGAVTPQDQAPLPWEQCMLGDTGNKRAVRILLECILVGLAGSLQAVSAQHSSKI